ncbi:hypothetical protein [Deinococcus planocerae]|uniref:hypothetical protein n=1 Tax=Deinococcus planocerae TaxID=1737569 RepID=UPI000C7F2841|nr:hypothetical protein [Deinococcus planocerae]
MTAARQTTAGTEDEFVTLDLVSPVGAIQRALVLESEALPAVLAVKAAAPALRELGLRHLTISVGPGGGLVLTCRIDPSKDDEYLPKRDLGVALMVAAHTAGGWVDDLIFQTTDAQ